jgi:hypothetical protein
MESKESSEREPRLADEAATAKPARAETAIAQAKLLLGEE